MSRECHKVFTSLPTFNKQLKKFRELTSIGTCDEPSFTLNQSKINTSLRVVAPSMTLHYQINILINIFMVRLQDKHIYNAHSLFLH